MREAVRIEGHQARTKIAPMTETNLWPLIMAVKGHCSLIFNSALVNSNCIFRSYAMHLFLCYVLASMVQVFPAHKPETGFEHELWRTTALIYVNAYCTISAIDVR